MNKFELILDKLIKSEISRRELGYKNKALNHSNQELTKQLNILKAEYNL
jgi:hypothetical protein